MKKLLKRNWINKDISEFIKNNADSAIVSQLYKANEANNRDAFLQLVAYIREGIAIQTEIDYHERMIEDYKGMIRDHRLERLEMVKKKNDLNYKIKRNSNK
jgi:uncharacterized protein YeeX (DUF496 family)